MLNEYMLWCCREVKKGRFIRLDNQISTDIDKEIVDAIKKLMIYSHPDKGICSSSDDFIKYKKLYDRIKGGK